jgi:hypothetical protein
VAAALVLQAGVGTVRADELPSMKAPSRNAPLRLFPSELGDFEKLVQGDPLVRPLAESLVVRRKGGIAVQVLGAVTLLGLSVPGALLWRDCQTRADMTLDCDDRNRSFALIVTGGVVGAGLFLLGLAISPSRAQFRDAIEQWNRRHPDAPLELRH